MTIVKVMPSAARLSLAVLVEKMLIRTGVFGERLRFG